jgi:hypothetical protein
MHSWRFRDGTRQLIAAIELGASATGSILVTVEQFERYRAKAQFEQLASQRLSSVQTRVAGALETINLLATYSEASGEASEDSQPL